ncbi:hypothetical protein [Streptomyces sp. SAJ15]|uniref:hypothetical protein n=1 Tax=Streptomyces sp. SAJ15 TaxID=2011095 RepID=UPI001186FD1F|nr:hypothetical protein [Streptomyces sp. SAJ15]TVL89731.1 hypothetical protein CD790_25360 [Streptomyces sp. SAJ15]
MPTTDSYGQGIQIAALTDAPNAATLAFNIVDALTGRANMRFASASARNAALPSPAPGMVAVLTTEKLITWYDGSGWVTMGFGAAAWTTISLAAGYGHNGNSNGNLQYRVVNLFGEQTVMLKGGINVTYPGTPGLIANGGVVTGTALPAAARPGALRSLTGACSTTNSDVLSVKIDCRSDGHIEIVGTTSASANPKIQPPWVSFNGLFYSL